jgi:hypothetical protein
MANQSSNQDAPAAGTLSAVSSLKEIVTVIMALTMTNTLVLLVTGGSYSSTRDLDELSGILILNIFRFYHGNIRHLDSVYGLEEQGVPVVRPEPRGGLGVDFFVILAQSILFAVMSFYADHPEKLLVLFTALLIFDVLWTLVVQQPGDQDSFTHQKKWMLNNFVALLAILVVYTSAGGTRTDVLVYAGAAAMLLNAAFDFGINWRFYFPPKGTNGTNPDPETSK